MKLSYCGLGVADVDAWMRFAVDALGMTAVPGSDTARLRNDEQSWRIAVHRAQADDVQYIGFELDADEEAPLRERLAAAAIGFTELDAGECVDRQIDRGIRVADPDGLRIEFGRGHKRADTPFSSALVREGFLTGEQGLGHVVLAVGDLDEGLAFYQAIGLRISDFITVPMGPGQLRIAFMHCNPRHHSLAIAPLPGPRRLNHIMVEVNAVDDVLQGYRRCKEQGYVTGNIGRHPNDRMLSFYVTSPAGFDIEYGWGGLAIAGEWDVAEYDQISIWGHERVA